MNTKKLSILIGGDSTSSLFTAEQYQLIELRRVSKEEMFLETTNSITENITHDHDCNQQGECDCTGYETLHMEFKGNNYTPESLAEMLESEEMFIRNSDGQKVNYDGIYLGELDLTNITVKPNKKSQRDFAIANLQSTINNYHNVNLTFEQVDHWVGSDTQKEQIEEWTNEIIRHKGDEGVQPSDVLELFESR